MDGCDIKIIAGLRKLKILFNDKLEIKSLLMTKNHHNDVYKLTKTSQFTATINAYLMISHTQWIRLAGLLSNVLHLLGRRSGSL